MQRLPADGIIARVNIYGMIIFHVTCVSSNDRACNTGSIISDEQNVTANDNNSTLQQTYKTIMEGLDGGVWYSLFIKNFAHYSSH